MERAANEVPSARPSRGARPGGGARRRITALSPCILRDQFAAKGTPLARRHFSSRSPQLQFVANHGNYWSSAEKIMGGNTMALNSIWLRFGLAAGALAFGLTADNAEAAKTPIPATGVESASNVVNAGAVVVDYQAQIQLNCATHECHANFVPLTAKQRYRLQKVTCFISVPSSDFVTEAYLSYTPPIFYFDLVKRSELLSSGSLNTVFDEEGPFSVPPGKTLSAIVAYGGSDVPSAYCSIYGQRITYP